MQKTADTNSNKIVIEKTPEKVILPSKLHFDWTIKTGIALT